MARKVILLCLFILALIPIWFTVIGSLQDISGVMKMPPRLIPLTFTLSNYKAMAAWPLIKWTLNTVYLVLSTVAISIIVHVSAGYIFAFYKFKLKSLIWSLLLLGLIIPRMTLLIPWYVVVKQLGIAGTLTAVMLTSVYSPINLYLARNYFNSVPKGIMEAARIDGASDLMILLHIILPLALPIIVVIGLFTAVGALTDYVWPSLVLQKLNVQTLMTGMIKEIMRRGTTDMSINPIGKQFAVSVVLLAPLLFIFMTANRYFISGITVGGIKE